MITDLELRAAGQVTYGDGTSDEFDAAYEDGNLIDPFAATSLASFQQLWLEKNTQIKAMLNGLSGTHSLAPGAPSPNKVVTDWTFRFAGQVARDDGTNASFVTVYTAKSGVVSSGGSVYAEVLADPTLKGHVKAVLGVLAGGVAHVTIT